MAILRERQTWKRERSPYRPRLDRLTPEEEENVRAAVRVLQRRLGSWSAVASAMGCRMKTVKNMVGKGGRRPTAGLALRAARLAGAPVEDVLSGAWPKPGACPMCGRTG